MMVSGAKLYRDGSVANVNWNDGKLYVNWYNRDNANDNLRSREVVLPKTRSSGSLVNAVSYPAVQHFRDFLKFGFNSHIPILLNYIKLPHKPDQTFNQFNTSTCGSEYWDFSIS